MNTPIKQLRLLEQFGDDGCVDWRGPRLNPDGGSVSLTSWIDIACEPSDFSDFYILDHPELGKINVDRHPDFDVRYKPSDVLKLDMIRRMDVDEITDMLFFFECMTCGSMSYHSGRNKYATITNSNTNETRRMSPFIFDLVHAIKKPNHYDTY